MTLPAGAAEADPRMPTERTVKRTRRSAIFFAALYALVSPVVIRSLSPDDKPLGLGIASLAMASFWAAARLAELAEGYGSAGASSDTADAWLDMFGRARALVWLPAIAYLVAVVTAQVFGGKNSMQSFSSLFALLGFAALADLLGGQYKNHRSVLSCLQDRGIRGWWERNWGLTVTCIVLLALGSAASVRPMTASGTDSLTGTSTYGVSP